MNPNGNSRKSSSKRSRTREWILMWVGIGIVIAEFVHAELLGGTFHSEFLIGAVALCGVGIAQWGDRR